MSNPNTNTPCDTCRGGRMMVYRGEPCPTCNGTGIQPTESFEDQLDEEPIVWPGPKSVEKLFCFTARGLKEHDAAIQATTDQRVAEALDLLEHRIDCNTVISELYGWRSIVAMSKEQTLRQLASLNKEEGAA